MTSPTDTLHKLVFKSICFNVPQHQPLEVGGYFLVVFSFIIIIYLLTFLIFIQILLLIFLVKKKFKQDFRNIFFNCLFISKEIIRLFNSISSLNQNLIFILDFYTL